MSYSDSIDIECSPDAAFAVVTDLPHMDRLSPENTGGEWIADPSGPRVGAKFKGANAHDNDSWFTIAKVVIYDPPHRFAFKVTYKVFNIARWEFRVETAPGGCRVTETWTDRRNALIRRQGDTNGFIRSEFTKESIRTTLVRLKKFCELPNQAATN
jgi:hypothetical protein